MIVQDDQDGKCWGVPLSQEVRRARKDYLKECLEEDETQPFVWKCLATRDWTPDAVVAKHAYQARLDRVLPTLFAVRLARIWKMRQFRRCSTLNLAIWI